MQSDCSRSDGRPRRWPGSHRASGVPCRREPPSYTTMKAPVAVVLPMRREKKREDIDGVGSMRNPFRHARRPQRETLVILSKHGLSDFEHASTRRNGCSSVKGAWGTHISLPMFQSCPCNDEATQEPRRSRVPWPRQSSHSPLPGNTAESPFGDNV